MGMEQKIKKSGYLLIVFLGLAWILRQVVILKPQVSAKEVSVATGSACLLQGDEGIYQSVKHQNESDDLFVSCGGFL